MIRYAIENKIGLALFYLSANDLRNLETCSKLKEQRARFLSTLADVSKTLDEEGVTYSLFKTLKPIPCTPVDIDLLLKSKEDFNRVVAILSEVYNGEIVENDRWTAGIHLTEKKEIVEPHLELHVHDWVYLQKKPLLNSTYRTKVLGEPLTTLTPEAEIVVIVAHSLYKEQLITLNDVLSVYCFLKISDRKSLEKLLSETNTYFALNTFLWLAKNAKKFPLRLNPIQTLAILFERNLNDIEARSTFPMLLTDFLKSKGIGSLVNHLRRRTYIRGPR